MSEFKVGDKVRFTEPGCGSQFEARRVERTVGTVTNVDSVPNYGYSSIQVDWKDGRGYQGGIGTSPKDHLEYAFKLGSVYKYTDIDNGKWFTIKLDRLTSPADLLAFVGTVQDRGTFYANHLFDDTVWGPLTHVNADDLTEITPEKEVTPVSKLPSFLVHVDEATHDRVLYPFEAQGRYINDAEGGDIALISGPDTEFETDEELARFIVQAVNEKIERDR